MESNVRLRTARESMPSPLVADEPMSRAELADAVNAQLWRTTGQHHCVDAHTIARYERGAVRWPGAAYRSALRAVLGAASDAELGFFPTRRGAAAQPPNLDDVPDLRVARCLPARVGWHEVEHVRTTTAALASSDNLFGGGMIAEGSVAQLRVAAATRRLPGAAPVRTALAEAVGNMAAVVAYVALDVGDHGAADRCLRFSLRCADEAGSWSLRSNTLTDMARAAAMSGRLDDALSLVELAQVRSDRLTPRARAMTAMLRGRFLACLGREAEAIDELRRSDEWMGGAATAADPPWLCYYDEAEHAGSTARALVALAERTRDPGPAVDRLNHAIESAGERSPRSRTFSRVRLAALLMRTGDAVEASSVGAAAVRESRAFDSPRLRSEIDDLGRSCALHPRSADAVELGQEIAALRS